MCCQSKGCAPARWWRHVESVSGRPWEWRGERRAPGTRWSQCRSRCAASSAAGGERTRFLLVGACRLLMRMLHKFTFWTTSHPSFGGSLVGWAFHSHLLFVVGRVRQQGRHVEHELVVLEGCVQGVCSSGVGCGKRKWFNWHHLSGSLLWWEPAKPI